MTRTHTQELLADELEALACWRGQETSRVEVLTLGGEAQLTFEASQAYEQRKGLLSRAKSWYPLVAN